MYPGEFELFNGPNARTFGDRTIIALDTTIHAVDSDTKSIYDLK